MQQNPYWHPPDSQHHYDVRAFIFGIVSFLFCQLPLIPVGTGIIAVVYAGKAKKQRVNSRGMTIAGLILGIIGISIGVLATIYWAFCFLGILMMLYRETDMIPVPSDSDFFDTPGMPAALWSRLDLFGNRWNVE